MTGALRRKTEHDAVSAYAVLCSSLERVREYGNMEISLPSARSFRRFLRKCIRYGKTDIPMPDAEQVGQFLKTCVEYGNTDIPMPDAEQVGQFVKDCIQFGKEIVRHCMTEKIDDSEDVMHAFSEAMEYMQIKLRSRMKLLVRVVCYLFHGRCFCISTQCLIL